MLQKTLLLKLIPKLLACVESSEVRVSPYFTEGKPLGGPAKFIYNIARKAAQLNSVYVSVLKIPIMHADSLSKSLRQNFFFARAAIVSEGGKYILYFATLMDTNRDSAHQSQNEDNFATFSLGLEFLNEAEKEKNYANFSLTANNHFWYCCPFSASDLLDNSTGYVIKQLVHAFSCAPSSYGARGKFGEHSRSYRLGQLLRFFRALQTSHVIHNLKGHAKA